MIVEKIRELISFKRKKWLEKNISFNTQKRNLAKNYLEKDFYILRHNAFFGKAMESVRNHFRLEFFLKDDTEKIIELSTKTSFEGIHKSYENCHSYIFWRSNVLTDKPLYLGIAIVDLSYILMYETYWDKFQPLLGQEKIQVHFIDTDSFV